MWEHAGLSGRRRGSVRAGSYGRLCVVAASSLSESGILIPLLTDVPSLNIRQGNEGLERRSWQQMLGHLVKSGLPQHTRNCRAFSVVAQKCMLLGFTRCLARPIAVQNLSKEPARFLILDQVSLASTLMDVLSLCCPTSWQCWSLSPVSSP